MDKGSSAAAIGDALRHGKQIIESVERLMVEAQKSGSEAAQLIAAGKIHEVRQAFQTARSLYEHALHADPEAFEASVRLAILLQKNGESRRSLAAAKALAARNADFSFSDISGRPRSLQTVLGDAYRDCGESEAAAGSYRRALKLQPADTHAASQLAVFLIDNGQVDAALDLAGKAMDKGGFEALNATAALLANNPNRLPAIQGIVTSMVSRTAMHV